MEAKHLERPEVPPRPLNPFASVNTGGGAPPNPPRPPTPAKNAIPTPPTSPSPSLTLPPTPPPPPAPPAPPAAPLPPPPLPVVEKEQLGEGATVALFNEINSKGLEISEGYPYLKCFLVIFTYFSQYNYLAKIHGKKWISENGMSGRFLRG